MDTGLWKYLWIQNNVLKIVASEDREFQRKFNAFYRVRKNENWQKKFYSLLQAEKNKKPNFQKILLDLFTRTKRIEASFSSKLTATINTRLPVIDSIVLKNLREMGHINMRLPYYYIPATERISKIVELHKNLEKLFNNFLRTPNGKYLIKEFKKMYPWAKITYQKMLDLVLWQKR